MRLSKPLYYLHFILLCSFFFLTNDALALNRIDIDKHIAFQKSVNPTISSINIDYSSPNHKQEYPEKEGEQDLEENNKEEVREKNSKKNHPETYCSSFNFPEVNDLQTTLLQKTIWSILKSYNNIHRHNKAIISLYCVFRC